jgi:DNA-directed RNA polymerase specialized sigma24 family protein
MDLEEALVIFRANPRDREAWEGIATGVYEPLLMHVNSLLFSFRVAAGETAADVVHAVLLNFLARAPNVELKSREELLRYLRRSCRNLLIDKYRHEKNSEQLLNYLSLRFGNAFPGETELYRSIFLGEIIDLLPKNCGEMLRLYVTEELSPAEMAEREEAAPSAFYSRWSRCIAKAKEIFLQKKGRLNR